MLKRTLIAATILMAVVPATHAQSISGQVSLKDGRTIRFTKLIFETDPIRFSKDIKLRPVEDWSQMRLPAIAKIEFLDLNSSEKSGISAGNNALPTSTRKANVIMRSGTVYKNIYLILNLMGWESSDETGNFYEERTRSIAFDPVAGKDN